MSVARGSHASRPRGRHLLRSSRIADAIVRDARVAPGDLVVDVGAGTGMLTRALDRAGARVLAIEPDAASATRLRRSCPRASVLEADARRLPWPREPFRVVANLPFVHAAEILRSLLADPRVPVVSVDAIVQWELAVKRTRLWPSTRASILWSAWHELVLARRLAPAAFAPPPSVVAGVLRATRRGEPLVPVEQAGAYGAFLERAYRLGAVSRVAPRALVAAVAGDPRASARDLDAHTWADLYASVRRAR